MGKWCGTQSDQIKSQAWGALKCVLNDKGLYEYGCEEASVIILSTALYGSEKNECVEIKFFEGLVGVKRNLVRVD